MLLLAQFVNIVCNVLIILMLVRSVLSWFMYSGNAYNSAIGQVFRFATAVTEPIIAPVRRFLSRFMRTGPMDFAPLATFFLIVIVRQILVRILYALA